MSLTVARARDETGLLDLPEYEARSHGRVDHFVAERLPGQIVEAITGAVCCDEIIGVDLPEFRNCFVDIIIVKRRHDMEAADYRALDTAWGSPCGITAMSPSSSLTGSNAVSPTSDIQHVPRVTT